MNTSQKVEPAWPITYPKELFYSVDPNPIMQTYIPEMIVVEKDIVYALVSAAENMIEYANECLAKHDKELGRTTKKNKTWASAMEFDIENAQKALEHYRKTGI